MSTWRERRRDRKLTRLIAIAIQELIRQGKVIVEVRSTDTPPGVGLPLEDVQRHVFQQREELMRPTDRNRS